MQPRVVISWSSGKDSAWTLHVLRQQEVNVVALLTTFNEGANRVAMHAVRRQLVEQQAAAIGLPLWPVLLPEHCSNEEYENRMLIAIERAKKEGVTHVAFGDLFLQEIRDYRVRQLAPTEIRPLFPLWCSAGETPTLAHKMIANGLKAVITCVDAKQLSPIFLGRTFDESLLADLPPTVDPCGERGEFHTLCFAGPMFADPLQISLGHLVSRDEFHFVDVIAESTALHPTEDA